MPVSNLVITVVLYLIGRFFLRCSNGTSQENGQSQHEEETKHFALVPHWRVNWKYWTNYGSVKDIRSRSLIFTIYLERENSRWGAFCLLCLWNKGDLDISLNWRLTCYKESLKSEIHVLHEREREGWKGGRGRRSEVLSFLVGFGLTFQTEIRHFHATFRSEWLKAAFSLIQINRQNILYQLSLKQNKQTNEKVPFELPQIPANSMWSSGVPLSFFHQSSDCYCTKKLHKIP